MITRFMSLVLPGAGQLVRLRLADGVLMLVLALWIRLLIVGVAWHPGSGEGMAAGFAFGAPGLDGGLKSPVAVVLTLVLLGLHMWSGFDAGRSREQT